MISVIIPARNAAATLGDQLEALAAQSGAVDCEVIVADNGSTDETVAVARSLGDRFQSFKVIDASARAGAAPARNIGAAAATGDAFVFCDADDRVAPGWLDAMAQALSTHQFITGSIDHDSLNPAAGGTHWRSHVSSVPVALHFLPYALSGNMAVTRNAFEAVGGFPEDLGTVGEDVAISWELQLAGYELSFHRPAVVAYRHRQDRKDLWGQHYRFGLADAALYRRFRARGMPPQRARSSPPTPGSSCASRPW